VKLLPSFPGEPDVRTNKIINQTGNAQQRIGKENMLKGLTNDLNPGRQTPDFSALRSPLAEIAPSTQKRSLAKSIREVWRGERSLAETWWIWNVLIGKLGIDLGLGLLAGMLAEATGSLTSVAVFVIIALPYTLWTLVGCFRSAWARQGFWGWVVIILCILYVLNAVRSISSLAQM
jgi:hypothetical protein